MRVRQAAQFAPTGTSLPAVTVALLARQDITTALKSTEIPAAAEKPVLLPLAR